MQKLINRQFVRQGFVLLHWGLALLPTLFYGGLVGMSLRATQLLGKFPQPSVNDPYLFGQDDATYQQWIWLTNLSFHWTILSWIPWCCLVALTLFFHRRYWSKQDSMRTTIGRFLPIVLYLFSHLVILFEPTNRLGWFLD